MKPKITNSRMYLSDEWYLEHDEQSTNLVNEEVRPNKKGKQTTYREIYYYGSVKQALKAYLDKSLKHASSIQDLLDKMNEAISDIDKLATVERWHMAKT